MRRRRCLIPADGYYEWSGAAGRKQAYQVTRADNRPFAFAGLWEHWMGADGSELETAAIITCAALPPMAAIHPRMPVIVAGHLRRDWLANEGVEAESMIAQLLSHPDPTLITEPVELERRAPVPKPQRATAGQLKLF